MITADLLAEMLDAAESEGVVVRALGGTAVQLRCKSAQAGGALHRECGDIDLATNSRSARAVKKLLSERGYQPVERFNTLHGRRRLLFTAADGHHADVFIDTFAMCHTLDLRGRLGIDPRTLTLADLLLTKLQIAEANRKDMTDVVALLLDHELSDDDSGVNLRYIGKILSADWGWWRTVSGNLIRLDGFVDVLELDRTEQGRARAQIQAILETIERAPKSARWRLRARVGDRVPWREEPEEVAG